MKFEIYQRKADKAWFLPLNPDDIRPSDYEKTYEGNINGLPDNPPASLWYSDCKPSRERVVLVAMTPAIFVILTMSIISNN